MHIFKNRENAFFSSQAMALRSVFVFFPSILAQVIHTTLASSAALFVASFSRILCWSANKYLGVVALKFGSFVELFRSLNFRSQFHSSCAVLVSALSSVLNVCSVNIAHISNNKGLKFVALRSTGSLLRSARLARRY